jgi:hypothetical protein
MQAGFGNQMGTESWEVVCDEHCIGGGCKYFGNNDAQLDRINVFYHGASGGGASGGKYVPRAVLFDLKSGQGTLRNGWARTLPKQVRGQQLGQRQIRKGFELTLLNPHVA